MKRVLKGTKIMESVRTGIAYKRNVKMDSDNPVKIMGIAAKRFCRTFQIDS